MKEEWELLKITSKYEASTDGRIRNAKSGRILSQQIDKQGRPRVSISVGNKKRNLFVKNLVADTFLPLDEHKPNVRNKDGNPLNNKINNLERISVGKKVRVVETGKIYSTIRECSKDTGLNESSISKCCNYPFYKNAKKLHFESVE